MPILVALAAIVIQYLPFAPFRIEDEAGVRYPINAAIIAICLGVLVRNSLGQPAGTANSGRFIIRYVLPVAIVLIGAGLDLSIMMQIGLKAMMAIIVAMAVALGAAMLLGRALGMSRRVSALVGIGTAICGSSAIAAAAPVLKADEEEFALSVATVNLLGLIVMLLLPLAGVAMAVSPEGFGVWAGTTIHAVPQAIAAGFAFGGGAGEIATLVKLVRVAMLAPLIVLLAVLIAHRNAGRSRVSANAIATANISFVKLVPWFIYGFVALAVINTILHALPANGVSELAKHAMTNANHAGGLLLVLSMAAIGLDVLLSRMIATGRAVLLVGIASSAAMIAIVLALVLWLI
jgi:uncharacterized integral membrane protein (TIGR00698 family)